MTITELNNEINNIRENYNKIEFKLQSILLASTTLSIEKYKNEEHIVRYDELRIIEEFLYKEKELIYFVFQFLNNINLAVGTIKTDERNIFSPPLNDKFSFYFDSLVTQLYSLFESEQRIQLQHYFNKDKSFDFYPNRNEFGLWWEVYMLRNRVVHYTENRCISGKEECTCYYSFSSKCNMVGIDKNGNIIINSTLIDIYKDNYVKQKIEEAIVTRDNPFDLIFPNKSASGYNKKYPVVNIIDSDIWFDYSSSGIRLLNEVNTFLNSINDMFFDYISNQLINKEELMNSSIALLKDGKEMVMPIKDLY